EEEWEFGYAIGLSRPIVLAARPDDCTACGENFSAGAELYGGLGTHEEFGLRGTSHYLGLLLGWDLPSGLTLRLSPAFGLNDRSHRFVLRWGVSYEFEGCGRGLRRALGEALMRASAKAVLMTGALVAIAAGGAGETHPWRRAPASAHARTNPFDAQP